MSLLDAIVTYLFRREQHESYVRALAHERKRRPKPRSRAAAIDEARRGLDAADALTFGTLPDGTALRIARPIKTDPLTRGNPHVLVDNAALQLCSLPDRDALKEDRILYHCALFYSNVWE